MTKLEKITLFAFCSLSVGTIVYQWLNKPDKPTTYFINIRKVKELPVECDTMKYPPKGPCVVGALAWPCCAKFSTRPCDTLEILSGPCRAGNPSFPCCAEEIKKVN